MMNNKNIEITANLSIDDEYRNQTFTQLPDREVILCECGDCEHQIILSNYKDEYNNRAVFMSYYLSNRGFWFRLKEGLKYIFGKRSMYGDFGEMVLTEKNAGPMVESMAFLLKLDVASGETNGAPMRIPIYMDNTVN